MSAIGVLGAGTWGVALARMLTNCGHAVTVWSRNAAELQNMETTRRHKNLPDTVIPDETAFTAEIGNACKGKELVLFAVPSKGVRMTARAAAPYLSEEQILVDVAKGLEPDTLLTMSQVIRSELAAAGKPDMRIVALSGPTHAEEVARDLPTTIISASEDPHAAEIVQDVFMNSCMRVYTNRDVEGVELCGAVKNIIALAAGISAGLGFGDNAKAALITRGMTEIRRLGLALGCHEETFSGLAGIGDLIVTATSQHSRNNRCGFLIGQGLRSEDAVQQIGMVVEGIYALAATVQLAEKYGVEMPIVQAVDRVINHRADPRTEVAALMTRDKKSE